MTTIRSFLQKFYHAPRTTLPLSKATKPLSTPRQRIEVIFTPGQSVSVGPDGKIINTLKNPPCGGSNLTSAEEGVSSVLKE